MKTSFVQIFDDRAAALQALGYVETTHPDHDHRFVESSDQVQVWTTMEGKTEAKAYGGPNPSKVYLLLSIAPD